MREVRHRLAAAEAVRQGAEQHARATEKEKRARAAAQADAPMSQDSQRPRSRRGRPTSVTIGRLGGSCPLWQTDWTVPRTATCTHADTGAPCLFHVKQIRPSSRPIWARSEASDLG
ncbi:hypothetical protein GCM10009608_67190 [Pseudonocardia alaniniphila]